MNKYRLVRGLLNLSFILSECFGAFNLTTDFQKMCPSIKSCHTITNQMLALEKNESKSSSDCCSLCSCKPQCKVSRDCCPDVAQMGGEGRDTNNDIEYKCLPLGDILPSEFDPNRNSIVADHFLTIQSCPELNLNNDNRIRRDGCLSQFSSLVVDYIPVVSLTTSRVYKNYHCALCHNVTDLVAWQLESNCLDLYLLERPPETMDKLRAVTQSCHVRLKPPVSQIFTELQTCRTDSYNAVISSCNQTGDWDTYDEYVFAKCISESYISYFFIDSPSTVESKELIFKNPFCFICNSKENVLQSFSCTKADKPKMLGSIKPNKKIPSFTTTIPLETLVYNAMMNENNTNMDTDGKPRQTDETPRQCGLGQYLDPYKHFCRELLCPIDKYAFKGLCILKTSQVDYLTFALNLRIQVTAVLMNEISGLLTDNDFIQSLNTTLTKKIFGKCKVENIIVEGAINTFTMTPDIFVKIMVTTTKACWLGQLLKFLTFIDTDAGNPFKVNQEKFKYEIGISYSKFQKGYAVALVLVNGSVPNFVELRRFFYCPRIVLTIPEYNEAIEAELFGDMTDSLRDSLNTLESDSVEICLTDYEMKFRTEIYKAVDSEPHTPAMAIISAVCTILSMTCTLAVLITFAFFKELRFMPGKLFIMLCANLLIAQGFFQFGLDVGGSGSLCIFLGITIHYFWLAVAFSMNSCVWLMFNRFHCPLHTSSRSDVFTQNHENAAVFKFALYSYSCPLIFILINVIVSYIMTNHQSVGYGGSFCYISSALMRGTVFALPMGVIVLINFILFGIVLYDIKKVRPQNFKADSGKGCRQVTIFLKFSSITGIYWSFGFLYEVTGLAFLGYIFIILNAGQGIFLMASFLFNRKVALLYRNMFGSYINQITKSRSSFEIYGENSDK